MAALHRPTVSLAATMLVLAACQETGTEPLATTPPPEARAPAFDRRMFGEGYAQRGENGVGFIYGRDGQPKQVTYEVQGSLAIWEGDIVIGPAATVARTREELLSREPGPQLGVYIDGAGFRWPGGTVPYEIDGALPNTARVTNAIAMVEAQTAGINLVPRNGEANFVRFVPGSGCSSPIGMQGGQQNITLDSDCTTGNAAHEIIHALGLFHEHTRLDRDDFVTVFWDNIEDGKAGNFQITTDAEGSDDGLYDEGSMMHYPTHGFSKNGLPTLQSKRGLDNLMGQRDSLGPTDRVTLNFLYGADNAAPTADIAALAASYPEGTTIAFDGSGSSDPDDADLTWCWDFGDGSDEDCTTGPEPSHAYADNGAYTVTLTVSDGSLEDEASTTATITNVAPSVTVGADASRNEGQLFTRAGSFTDPGADSWTATVDYGDGSGAQALALVGKTFNLSHTYANGVVPAVGHTITVTVSDDDGGEGSGQLVVTVYNVNPAVTAPADASIVSGETYNFSGSFSDPGLVDYPWDWEIDWGFGDNDTGSTNNQAAAILASQQACAAGDYTVRLTVTDKDDGAGFDEMTLSVSYYEVGIVISPNKVPNAISLNKIGLVPVAILSTATFDATTVDPSQVVLGDESGSDTPVAQKNNGTWQSKLEDVNSDGLMDMIVMFSVQALVDNGDLTAGSTELVLRGFTGDACLNFRGVDAVKVIP